MQNKVPLVRIELLILILAILFFIPYLGAVHLFDWDEINFAEASREMIETGDYLTVRIDYQPFHEKPPFFFWFQVISMEIFGVNESQLVYLSNYWNYNFNGFFSFGK